MNSETLLSTNIIVPIFVAFVGFLVAVTTAVIAKEQKISEFRQKWVDELRHDICNFSTLILSAISEEYRLKHPDEIEMQQLIFSEEMAGIVKKRMKFQDEIIQASLIIKLKLNHKEHITLINHIDDVLRSLRVDSFYDGNESKLLDLMLTESHKVLKNEWKIVKKGEKHFVNFRGFGELCLFAFITAFFVLFYLAKFPEYFPGIN
jgi:hypothetical protein